MPRILIVIFAATAVLTLAAYVLLHGESRDHSAPTASPSAASPQAPAADTENKEPAVPVSDDTLNAVREEIRACYGDAASLEGVNNGTLGNGEAVFAALTGKLGTPQKISEAKNLHYELSDGSKRRIRLTRESSDDGKEYLRMRVFNVHEDGLPDPVTVKPEQEKNPSREAIEYYSGGGRLEQEQEDARLLYPDGTEIETSSADRKIVKFDLVRGRFRFSCGMGDGTSLSCKCLSKGE